MMTNRYHLPVVITTTDDLTREEATEYVESMLSNLEGTENVYRTFVEDTGIDDTEADRLLEMMGELDRRTLQAAVGAMEELEEDEQS